VKYLVVAFLTIAAAASAQVDVPPLRSPVTDLTGTLTSEQISALDQRLRAFEIEQGSQIAVLLVPTTQPETIEEYSIRVAEAWKLGRKGVDDGLLVLAAMEDRTVRIEVGYGLEGALPDALANRITDQVIAPRFRKGDFYGGLAAAIDRIIAIIEGEPLPEPLRRPAEPQGFGSALPIFLILVFVVSGLLRRMFGALGGAFFTSAAAGVLVWLATSLLGAAIGAAVLAFLFTIFSGGGGGRGWTSSRRGHHWGGGLGGGWGGGGGFGGGGGGSFGGGGASGRW
jgi:uncharacterized protein